MTKAATIPHIGTLADNVLKLRGRSVEFVIAPPTELDRDGQGYVVAWHYEDCDVILHYRQNAYRVREVVRFGQA